MSTLESCAWKLITPDKFTMGMPAERCGEVAVVKILRPYRKNDLCLCEEHLNDFIEHWGLHNRVSLLCHPEEKITVSFTGCSNPSCTKCLQDDPRTWRHE